MNWLSKKKKTAADDERSKFFLESPTERMNGKLPAAADERAPTEPALPTEETEVLRQYLRSADGKHSYRPQQRAARHPNGIEIESISFNTTTVTTPDNVTFV